MKGNIALGGIRTHNEIPVNLSPGLRNFLCAPRCRRCNVLVIARECPRHVWPNNLKGRD